MGTFPIGGSRVTVHHLTNRGDLSRLEALCVAARLCSARYRAAVDVDEVVHRRLVNHRLCGPPFDDPAVVVGAFAGMQAQEFAYALWSVAQRCGEVGRATMEAAFADGLLLRTHLLRPTWHFVRPADARWLMDLTSPRVEQVNGTMYRQTGLDDALLARTDALLADAVRDGPKTRGELAAMLVDDSIEVTGFRLVYILMRAEADQVLISGPPRGKQQTYASFDGRVPVAEGPTDPIVALAELARRFFATRGPATVKDFARWATLTTAAAREGLESVADGFTCAVVDGLECWYPPGEVDVEIPPATAHLVQCYDEYVMSYSESREFMTGGHDALTADAYYHGILVDGRLAGRWRHQLGRREATVQAQLLRPLSRREAAGLDEAVARYGEYLGLPAVLELTTG